MKKHHPRLCLAILCLCLCLPSLLLFAGCGSEPVDRNAITSVTISGDTLTVTAGLTEGFLKNSDDTSVYLLELPAHLSVDADISRLEAVAKAKPASALTFTVPAYDGTRSRLFSSFVVAIHDSETDRYTALTTPMALQNPEAAAPAVDSAYRPSGSIKGLANATPADALRLGVAHAVVDVSVGELLLPAWQEGAVPYVWNDTTAYLDGDTLTALDEVFSAYARAGVQVYLRVTLTGVNFPENPQNHRSGDRAATGASPSLTVTPNDANSGNFASTLTVAGATAGAEGYAIDMSSAETAILMEGFFNFLAGRYTTTETAPAAAFIIGYRVNNAPVYANAGEMSLDHYITNYEKLVRVAYTALRSHTADGRVYISLDDHRTANGMIGGWDIPLFLSAFAKEAALRGDYEWHVAAELYADTNRTWEDNAAIEADRFTVHNLQVLSELVNHKQNRADGIESRRLLISGLAIPATRGDGDESNADIAASEQAASYAYTYLSARQTGTVEALIYSAYTDADVPACGVWNTTDAAIPTTARPLWSIIRLMDTTEAAELSRDLTILIGSPYTKLESTLAGDPAPVTLLAPAATVSAVPDRHKNTSTLFSFTGGSQNGFVASSAMTYMELMRPENADQPVLYTRFDPACVGDRMTLTVTLPATTLAGHKELIVDFAGGTLSDKAGDDSVALTLSLTRPATGDAAVGDGALLLESTTATVQSGVFQSASFPIKDFAEHLKDTDTVTLTLYLDAPAENAAEAYELMLSGLYVTGSPLTVEVSPVLVILLVLILVLTVVGTVVFLYIRHRRVSCEGASEQ